MILLSALAISHGIVFAFGRASMARAVAEHDRDFNKNLRRLTFRIARYAYPKQKEPPQ